MWKISLKLIYVRVYIGHINEVSVCVCALHLSPSLWLEMHQLEISLSILEYLLFFTI